MKKLVSLFLTLTMVMSFTSTVMAAHETLVTYEGQGTSQYLLTVPAKLAPGETDDVKLEGTWPTNEVIHVTADPTVTLTNDIDSSTKVLDITFNGISQAGNNTESVVKIEDISVSSMTNALFGTWSGEFYYNLSIEDTSIQGYEIKSLDDILGDDGKAYLNVGDQVQLEAVAVYSVAHHTEIILKI